MAIRNPRSVRTVRDASHLLRPAHPAGLPRARRGNGAACWRAIRESMPRCDLRVFGCGLCLILVFFTGWQLLHLGGFRWDWDEGVYVMTARAVATGHRLYSEVFSMAPPGFIASLNLGFALAGESIQAGRGVIVLYAAAGLVAVALIAREIAGGGAGLAAPVMLALSPHFLVLSRTLIGDIPALAVGALALAATLQHSRTGRWRWLVAGGVLLAWGASLKLTAALVVPVIAWVILAREARWSGARPRTPVVLVPLLVFAGSALLPALICVWAYPGLLYETVVLLWTQSAAFPRDLAANLRMIQGYTLTGIGYVALNRGLTLAALAGIAVLAVHRRRHGPVALLWLAVTLVAMIGYTPLWPHLLSALLFPLAVAGGVAMAEVCRRVGSIRRYVDRPKSLAVTGLLIVGVAAWAQCLPAVWKENARHLKATTNRHDRQIVQLLQQYTEPTEYVITDEPVVAFYARRRIPPDLADCSIVRIRTGNLTAPELIAATNTYSPAAVVLGEDARFKDYLSRYVSWIRGAYTLVWADGDRQIFLRPDRAIRLRLPAAATGGDTGK